MSLWSAGALLRLEEASRARGRGLTTTLCAYVGVLLAVVATSGYDAVRDAFEYSNRGGAVTGERLFELVLLTQFVLLCAIGPMIASASVTAERERGSMELLATTLLRPIELWLGKMAAAMAMVWVLWWAGLPFLTLCMFLGGVDPGLVVWAYLLLLLVFVAYCAFAVWVSTRVQRTLTSIGIVLGTLLVLNLFLPYSYSSGYWLRWPDVVVFSLEDEILLGIRLLSPLTMLKDQIGGGGLVESLREFEFAEGWILFVVGSYALAAAGFAHAAVCRLRYPRG